MKASKRLQETESQISKFTEADRRDPYQLLFYALRADLRELAYLKRSVHAMDLLDVEAQYAEAENRIYK